MVHQSALYQLGHLPTLCITQWTTYPCILYQVCCILCPWNKFQSTARLYVRLQEVHVVTDGQTFEVLLYKAPTETKPAIMKAHPSGLEVVRKMTISNPTTFTVCCGDLAEQKLPKPGNMCNEAHLFHLKYAVVRKTF